MHGIPVRRRLSLVAVSAAVTVGTSMAHAQTVETTITPISAATVATMPVETVETVRTVRTSSPRRRRRSVARNRNVDVTVTKTTTVREGVVGAPAVVAAPSVVAVPAYDAPLQRPRLYDVLTLAPAVPVDPAVTPAATIQGPGYRYVYQPDRILVVDPYTNVAVQAIPR